MGILNIVMTLVSSSKKRALIRASISTHELIDLRVLSQSKQSTTNRWIMKKLLPTTFSRIDRNSYGDPLRWYLSYLWWFLNHTLAGKVSLFWPAVAFIYGPVFRVWSGYLPRLYLFLGSARVILTFVLIWQPASSSLPFSLRTCLSLPLDPEILCSGFLVLSQFSEAWLLVNNLELNQYSLYVCLLLLGEFFLCFQYLQYILLSVIGDVGGGVFKLGETYSIWQNV